MSDYITRQEFEEAINALRCYGDQQTINVTQTPGGQTISSTQVLTPTEDNDNPLAVTYDSVSETFTIDVVSLHVVQLDAGNFASYPIRTIQTRSFVFDKPVSNEVLELYILPAFVTTNQPSVYWVSDLTPDAATLPYKAETTRGYQLARFTIKSDGTWTTDLDYSTPQPIYTMRRHSAPHFVVSGAEIQLNGVWNPLKNTTENLTLAYSAPVDQSIIVGWNAGSTTYTLDLASNSGSYAEYITVGSVDIDASGNVRECVANRYHDASIGTMGFTGTDAYTNFTIENGIIINAS